MKNMIINFKLVLCTFGALVFIFLLGNSKPARTHSNPKPEKFDYPDNKYLPVCLLVNKIQKGDIYFYLGAALKKYSIKIVSKEEALDLSYFEMKNVYEQYYTNRDKGKEDFEEIKRKAASDLSYVVNNLEVNFRYDTIKNTIDSISFHAFPTPINMGNIHKSNWYKFDTQQNKTYSQIDLCFAIADSIINANILFKAK